MRKRPTQKQRILNALRAAGNRGVTTGEMMDMGIGQYQTRIYELRESHVIRSRRMDGTMAHVYWLEVEA